MAQANPLAVGKDGLMRHSFLTRLDVPHNDWPGDDASVNQRVHLFEHYSLPSLAAQTEQTFDWLVFVAAKSRLLTLFQGWKKLIPQLTVIEAGANQFVRQSASGKLFTNGGPVMTTRLDAGAVLANNFVERLNKKVRLLAVMSDAESSVINFDEGLQLDETNSKLRHSIKRGNQFSTLVEWKPRNGSPHTIWGAKDDSLHKLGLVEHVEDVGPMWMEIIHAGNTCDRRLGRSIRYRDRILRRFHSGVSTLRSPLIIPGA